MARMLAIVAAVVAITAAHPAAALAATVWAVGDGATATGPADGTDDDALGRFLASKRPFDRFLYLGDVYESGTFEELYYNYGGAFGAFRDISSPTPGDNEWANVATGYDPYWGTLAPQTPGGGHYYSFDVGGWHVISLNSLQPTGQGSAQLAWLQNDLEDYSGTCTIAIMHHPRYFASSQSPQPDTYKIEPLWGALEGRAVAVLSGHYHNYQRLKPDRGITQFIVGTGGRVAREPASDLAGRVLSSHKTTGALRLSLEPGAAGFDFFATNGSAPLDSSELTCEPHAFASKRAPKPSPLPPAPPRPAPAPAPSSAPTPAEGATSPAPATETTPLRAAPSAATASAVRPRISLRRPRGVSSKRGFTVVGRAHGARGAIKLSLLRRTGRGCQAFDGRRFRRSSCRARAVLVARGRESWRYRFRRPLPSGSYLLSARVTDAGGATAWASRRLTVR